MKFVSASVKHKMCSNDCLYTGGAFTDIQLLCEQEQSRCDVVLSHKSEKNKTSDRCSFRISVQLKCKSVVPYFIILIYLHLCSNGQMFEMYSLFH